MTLRLVGAVILGILTSFVLGFAGIAITWQALGAERAFQQGTTVASVPWSVVGLALAGAVAGLGGLVTSRIAKGRGPLAVRILAGTLLGIGLLTAFAGLGAEVKPLPEGKQAGLVCVLVTIRKRSRGVGWRKH